jgi:small redox-active disulfide protein 2
MTATLIAHERITDGVSYQLRYNQIYMKIQVLGSGCNTCKNLFELTKKAATELGHKGQVEYITGNEGIQKIIELAAVSSPLLVVDGKIAMTGFTPDIEKIKHAIQKAAK